MSKKEEDLPAWMAWVMVIGIMSFILLLAKWEVEKKREQRQQYLRDSFSRMSTNPEIQEAYEQLGK